MITSCPFAGIEVAGILPVFRLTLALLIPTRKRPVPLFWSVTDILRLAPPPVPSSIVNRPTPLKPVNAAQLSTRTRQTAAHSVLAVSGSASALTALQIDEAIRSGYEEIAVPIGALLATGHESTARQGLCERLKRLLSQGANVIVHTAKGPQDPRIAEAIDLLRSQGLEDTQARLEAGRQLSMRLGELIAQVLRAVRPSRLVLCGGDTSSQVAKVLAPEAIVAVAPLARGAPLCRFIARDSGLDGLLVVFKGGQMGEPAFIVQAGITEPGPEPEPRANPNPNLDSNPNPDPETPEDRDLR